MNFDFDEDQKALQDHARRFFGDRASSEAVREVLEGEQPFQTGLWTELAEMGFLGAAIPEKWGGSGFGYVELCLIAEEIGRSLAAVPFSSTVYLATELIKALGSEAQCAAWLPRIAAGEQIGCLAGAECWVEDDISRYPLRMGSEGLTGTSVPVVDGSIATFAIVLAETEDAGPALFLVDLAQPGVKRETLNSVDPSRGVARLTFAGATADPLGTPGEALAGLDAVLDRAAIFLAFEQIGGAEAALWMARDYSLERYAFGQPIGSFQAMKHMMADMYAALELARSNAYYGALALDGNPDLIPLAAAYSRISASKAYQKCSADNIQVHGGMGFTWEFDCHLHYRRAALLALQGGTVSSWSRKLVSRLKERDQAAA